MGVFHSAVAAHPVGFLAELSTGRLLPGAWIERHDKVRGESGFECRGEGSRIV